MLGFMHQPHFSTFFRPGRDSFTLRIRSKRRIKKAKKAVAGDKGEYVMQADLNEVFVGPAFDFAVRDAPYMWAGVADIALNPPCSRSVCPSPRRGWRSEQEGAKLVEICQICRLLVENHTDEVSGELNAVLGHVSMFTAVTFLPCVGVLFEGRDVDVWLPRAQLTYEADVVLHDADVHAWSVGPMHGVRRHAATAPQQRRTTHTSPLPPSVRRTSSSLLGRRDIRTS